MTLSHHQVYYRLLYLAALCPVFDDDPRRTNTRDYFRACSVVRVILRHEDVLLKRSVSSFAGSNNFSRSRGKFANTGLDARKKSCDVSILMQQSIKFPGTVQCHHWLTNPVLATRTISSTIYSLLRARSIALLSRSESRLARLLTARFLSSLRFPAFRLFERA